MAENSSVVLLRKAIEPGKNYIDACLTEDVSVYCINRATKQKKKISFNVLFKNNHQFWLQNESWEYFLLNEDFKKIADSAVKINKIPEPLQEEVPVIMPAETAKEIDRGFGSDFEAIVAMPEAERVEHIKEDKKKLDLLIAQKPKQKELVTEALVDTAKDTIMYNHAAIRDAMNLTDEEARKHTQSLVDSTYDLVKASTKLISSSIFNDELINTLVAKSNGTIIQHMTRVHLNGLAFLNYYNRLVSSSSFIDKLRINFAKNYRPFYEDLLPQLEPDKITLEKVFMGGMRAVSENDFVNWAVGFLIHDIGKAAAVEYHEGESAYNRNIVVEHVKVGYTSVMNKTNYPRDAGLITGYHHEYYGDQAGYGYFRSYLEQYKKANPRSVQGFCIAFEIEPMVDCQALAFFPAKVLEIIDVFDSVTDPNRKYRTVMTTEEALDMMHEEFINQHHKIDAVLFDIFKKFIQELPKS